MLLGQKTHVPPAPDLSRALAEARSIADGVGQPLTTAHLLLALFTVPNPAEVLLKDRGIDEDVLLALVPRGAVESKSQVRAVITQAEEMALRCDARQSNTLHLLVSFLRVRETLAFQLLEDALGTNNVSALRNQVMSFVTGVLPRRLLAPIQEARALGDPPLEPKPMRKKAARPVMQSPKHDWVVPKETFLEAPSVEEEEEEIRPLPESELPAEDLGDDDESFPPLSDLGPAVLERDRPHFHITTYPTTIPTDYDLDPDRFPWLTSLGRNLSALAALGELDPAIGRDAEVEQIIDVLGKRRANNPCLVGEPGVGKTAIAEGLAVKLASGAPEVSALFGKVIVELDMGRITAGTSLRGSFSERMQGLKKDVERARGKVIIFIDEIHTLMGAGGSGESPQDAANELKAALARGAFPCIGSTTVDEYRKFIEADPALERRFVKLAIDEPDDRQTIEILRGVAPLYEAHHKLKVDDDGVCAAVQLSSRFVHDRKLPGKAIDMLDQAMSRARRVGKERVGRDEIAEVCADMARVPLERIRLDDASRFLEMEKFVGERVVGHAKVIERVAETVRRNYAGFVTERPMGSFLFLGSTGVGKTELAKALAEFLYGTAEAMVRFDMSEFGESHTVARLIGAPPGYVGHQGGGQLTEGIRQRPHAVVLLDEIEKAHPDILPLLLQILDEGRLTDSKGRTVTFRHATLVMTSNLGVPKPGKTKRVGFGVGASEPEEPAGEDAALADARKHFSPELWGRIEDKLVFHPLTAGELRQVAGLLLERSRKDLETTRNITFRWDEGVLDCLVNHAGTGEGQGARFMRRAVQRHVEAPLAEAILRREVREGDRVALRAEGGHILARRTAG
jgi:ATP-dependent Clp protease ATP-binding subunit ClpC